MIKATILYCNKFQFEVIVLYANYSPGVWIGTVSVLGGATEGFVGAVPIQVAGDEVAE